MSTDVVELIARARTYVTLQRERPLEPMGTPDLMEEMADALERDHAIVAELANIECPVDTIMRYVSGDIDGLCPTCHATLTSDRTHLIEPHQPDCVWVRAREAVGGEG